MLFIHSYHRCKLWNYEKIIQRENNYLNKRGINPKFNIIDNVASKSAQAYPESDNIGNQLVEPHNRQFNAEERAIQTYKNNLIADLCSWDDNFPTILWIKLIRQRQDSLKMLRTSRVNPKVSVYQILEAPHDFNQIPFAPLSTRTTIFTPPETRSSWGTILLKAWYISPTFNHYQCWELYVPSTGGVRTSDQSNFYPTHYEIPT